MALTNRVDPYLNFRFLVEINGQVVAGFSDVSSIECEIDTEEYQEGGVNDHVHHLLKAAKYRNLVLKRGLTDSDVLWKWQRDAADGIVKRRTIRILLLDEKEDKTWHWQCMDAYPVRWTGPEFSGVGNSVAIETLELVHNGIKRY